MKLLDAPDGLLNPHLWFRGGSDFEFYTTTDEFSTVATDSGTAAVSDGVGGVITLTPSDGSVTDNDETYIKGTKEIYKFATDKPICIRSRVQFTEGNTDDANILVGMMNAVAANSIQDNGAGPPANSSHVCFFKVDGGTRWNFELSVGTSQVTMELDVTAGGASYQRLDCDVREEGGYLIAIPYIDGVQPKEYRTNGDGKPAQLRLAIGSPTEMQLIAGIKNGADTTAEALLVDYLWGYQQR